MAQSTINTERLKQFREALQKSPAKLREELQRTGVECAKVMEHHLKRKAPKFLGELSNSIEGVTEYLPNGVAAAAITSVPYAMVMDEGRRAGKMPPDEPIRRWVDLKLIKRGGLLKKRLAEAGRKRARKGERQQMLDSLTYLIRRKIAQKGTNPTHFIRLAMEAATPTLTKKMDALAVRVAQMLEDGTT